MSQSTMLMIFIVTGWIFFAFSSMRLIVALVNYISRPYLPPPVSGREAGSKVSVLVPARNEQENLPRLLDGAACWLDEIWELIIYDDMSTDGTYATALGYSRVNPKIKVIKGGPLPQGWLGKNHACHSLSQYASGDMLLFVDADITLNEGAISGAVEYMREYGLDLLSIFPTQVMDNIGSRLSVPLMNWILLGLLPLPAVRLAPYPSLAAANGQFLMFGRDPYGILSPHSRFRNHPVEDISIIRYYKEERLRTATLLGDKLVLCRMYSGLSEAVAGFSKNIVDFFGGSSALCWLFVLSTTIAPFWIFIFNGFTVGIIYVLIIALSRVFVSAASCQNIFRNLILAVPQQAVLWLITINATLKSKKKKLEWKGRVIS